MRPGESRFNDIQDMLTTPTGWWRAVTLNAYGTDGITRDWVRFLKTDPLTSGWVANPDTILETQDGLSWVKRL